jgi:hypothetical protein
MRPQKNEVAASITSHFCPSPNWDNFLEIFERKFGVSKFVTNFLQVWQPLTVDGR